jgi:acetyl esterase/lipase
MFGRSAPAHRQRLLTFRPTFSAADAVSVQEHEEATVYIPNDIKTDLTLFYIAGTAFVGGERDITKSICSNLANVNGCLVISLNHVFAPEAIFPEGLNSLNSNFKAIMDKADAFRIKKERMMIAGYSSGGNFALLLSKYAKYLGYRFIARILICPTLDLSRSDRGYGEFEEQDPIIKESFLSWMISNYISTEYTLEHEDISPLFNEESLSLSTQNYLVCGEFDRCRGDTERASVACRGHAYKIIVHGENHAMLWRDPGATKSLARLIYMAGIMHFVDRFPADSKSSCDGNNGFRRVTRAGRANLRLT